MQNIIQDIKNQTGTKLERLCQIYDVKLPPEIEPLQCNKRFEVRSDRIMCVDLHPKHNLVLVALYNGYVLLWQYETKKLLKTFEVSNVPVRVAKFVKRKHWIVCGSDDFRITVYNYKTSERIKQFDAHRDYLCSIIVHPIQPYIISSSNDSMIQLWNWKEDFLNVQAFRGHTDCVTQLVMNPKDSTTFASASLDKTIKVWELGSTVDSFTLEGHEAGVNCVDYFPNNDRPYLFSGSDDKTVKIWNYETKTCVQTLDGHNESISSVIYYPDWLILAGSKDSTLHVWNMNSFRLEKKFSYGTGCVWTMTCLRKRHKLAIGCGDRTIVLKLGHKVSWSKNRIGQVTWSTENGEISFSSRKDINPNSPFFHHPPSSIVYGFKRCLTFSVTDWFGWTTYFIDSFDVCHRVDNDLNEVFRSPD